MRLGQPAFWLLLILVFMKGSLQWPIGASAGPLRVLSYTLTHKHELITADKWNKCKYGAAFLISNKSFHQTIGNKCRVWHQPVLHCNKTNAHTHTGHKSFRQMLNTSVFPVAVRSISHRAEQCGLNPSGLIPHTQLCCWSTKLNGMFKMLSSDPGVDFLSMQYRW